MHAMTTGVHDQSFVANGETRFGFAVEDGVAIVTFSNPPINSLTAPDVAELVGILSQLELDARVCAVVLTGGVRGSFCSGGDLGALFGEEMRSQSDAQRLKIAENMQSSFDYIAQYSKPTIAAINGVAFGAGLELALVCDFRVASELASLAFPELGHQIIPALGATQRLIPLIGLSRAKEMLMTGRRVRAQEAFEWGLVHALAPRRDTVARAVERAQQVGRYPTPAFAALKRSLHRGLYASPDIALREETREFDVLLRRRLRSGKGERS